MRRYRINLWAITLTSFALSWVTSNMAGMAMFAGSAKEFLQWTSVGMFITFLVAFRTLMFAIEFGKPDPKGKEPVPESEAPGHTGASFLLFAFARSALGDYAAVLEALTNVFEEGVEDCLIFAEEGACRIVAAAELRLADGVRAAR